MIPHGTRVWYTDTQGIVRLGVVCLVDWDGAGESYVVRSPWGTLVRVYPEDVFGVA